jgi:hypothetical protein
MSIIGFMYSVYFILLTDTVMYIIDVHLTIAYDACNMFFGQVSVSCGLHTNDR